MKSGKQFWTLAIVLGLCLLATAGCRRRRSGHTTIRGGSVFTTDDFPGASVQDNNVADDQRAFSASTDSFAGGLVCTHNGDRGTMMVTYGIDGQLFSHYFDGSAWTPGVVLRHWDTQLGFTAVGDILHAFVNTGNDSRSDARDRDGDCLIFWNARDFDTDGPGSGDEENQVLYMSYFDVSHYQEAGQNYGFDIDPGDPGFFWAQRVSTLEFGGEDVQFQGLVTDGLCGEARWQDNAHNYRYGDETSAIFVFYHQQEEKSPGVWDETTQTAGFDLDLVLDEEFPLTPTADVEIAIQGFGASDTGVDCQETCVGVEYASYNDILMYRVRSFDGSFATTVPTFGSSGTSPGPEVDVTLQYTFFNFGTFALTTDCINTVDPDSTTAVGADDMNSDFTRLDGLYFLGSAGLGAFGRDEGLSCFVVFFAEAYDANNAAPPVWAADGTENVVAIAEIDEDTGAFLNDAESSVLPIGEGTVINTISHLASHAVMSRNGDYIWIAYERRNGLGSIDDFVPELVQYATTRLDSDGNPQPVPLLSSTLGLPHQMDPEDGNFAHWMMFQDNLGYRCGIQSDAAVINFFFAIADGGTGNSLVYACPLVADVDGAVGGETVGPLTLLIDEDIAGFHYSGYPMNHLHLTFNATDAGQDGDYLYMYVWDDNETNGISDIFVSAGRGGVTSASPIVIGSGIAERQSPVAIARYLEMIATPPGQNIGSWNPDSAAYDGEAHHGAEFVHLVFREAETSSVPLVLGLGGNTTTGYALRTRTYSTDLGGGTFGDDFTPNAGTAFRAPFDIDLPFMDPDTFDDAEVLSTLVCQNTVVLVFVEAGHVYYQECNPGDGDEGQPGWRQEAPGVSDPALVDDDTAELISFFEEVCSPGCACCNIDGSAIFWAKNLDDGSDIDRLQVRVIDRGGH